MGGECENDKGSSTANNKVIFTNINLLTTKLLDTIDRYKKERKTFPINHHLKVINSLFDILQ